MHKISNKPFSGVDRRFRGNLAASNWTLCVGAGISFGFVPTWMELTRRAINIAFKQSYDAVHFEELVKETRWSLDALLQGVANQLNLLGRPADDFGNLLEECLYGEIIAKAKANKVDSALVDALNNPRWLKQDEFNQLLDFIESDFSDTTLVRLAKCLAAGKLANKSPMAIINFNADTLLHALLDMYLINNHASKIGSWQYPAASFKKTFRGIEGVDQYVTPIFHCHGAVAPALPKRRYKTKRRDARDHLVFTEADYLSIAGTVATWAQALFLFYAQSSRLLIIGHSLSDPNIRKWLGWSLNTTIQEISAVSAATEHSPRHIWMAKKPADTGLREIQEISLLHLGVRVCWLNDWNEIGPALENLLGL